MPHVRLVRLVRLVFQKNISLKSAGKTFGKFWPELAPALARRGILSLDQADQADHARVSPSEALIECYFFRQLDAGFEFDAIATTAILSSGAEGFKILPFRDALDFLDEIAVAGD